MQTIKIFLASSSELKTHRDEFNLFIYEKTKRLVKQGIFLETVWWEHFLDTVSDTRLQTEYNKALADCDIALCMFYTKAGKYTQEEFEVAYKQFKTTGKPYIYTYFYDGQVNMQSINVADFASLQAFKNRLAELGHFFTLYKNVEELKYKFSEQLEILIDKLITINTNMVNTTTVTGNNNITIQDVQNSTITLNVNGEMVEVRHDIAELRQIMLKHKQPLETAEKIYNIGEINQANFGKIINNYYYQSPKTTHPLFLWILSTTKKQAVFDKSLTQHFPTNRYHETDCTAWQPFENEGTMAELIAEYKKEVNFEIKERFLESMPIEKTEKATFYKNIDKFVLVIDPLALHTVHIKTANYFNNDKIGACLVLLCQSVSFELFAYIRTQVEQVFGVLHTCSLDYKEKYLHFMFPIPTKQLFFRTLSNIALLKLEIATEIQDLDTDKKIFNKKFTF